MRGYVPRQQIVDAIDSLFDYRYSQLPLVFGKLVHKGSLGLEDLEGLEEEKLAYVRFMQR
jgi:hypothetical protein